MHTLPYPNWLVFPQLGQIVLDGSFESFLIIFSGATGIFMCISGESNLNDLVDSLKPWVCTRPNNFVHALLPCHLPLAITQPPFPSFDIFSQVYPYAFH
jgi:hypothetical protein